MPRLLGVDIPGEKRIEASLPYIYGIGPNTARRILEQANIDLNIRAKDLTPSQIGDIIHAITASKLPIEGDLRRELQGNLKRLQAINCYPSSRWPARAWAGLFYLRPHPQWATQDRGCAACEGRQEVVRFSH